MRLSYTERNENGVQVERTTILVSTAKYSMSGFIRELHDLGKSKRYSFRDMLPYHGREPAILAAVVQLVTPNHGNTPVVIADARIARSEIAGKLHCWKSLKDLAPCGLLKRSFVNSLTVSLLMADRSYLLEAAIMLVN